MNKDEFCKRHKSNSYLAERGLSIVLSLWVLWALFCLSLVGGLIYVAAHFISKVW